MFQRGMAMVRSGHRYKGNFPRELSTADAMSIDDSAETSDSKTQASLRSEIWVTSLEPYGQRNPSLPEDRLSAVAGIATQLDKTWNDTYLAGLWQSNILRQLAWQKRKHL